MRTKEGDLFGNVPIMIVDCLNNTSTANQKKNKIAELNIQVLIISYRLDVRAKELARSWPGWGGNQTGFTRVLQELNYKN